MDISIHPNSTSYSTNNTPISQAPRIVEREFPTTCRIAVRPPASFFFLPFFFWLVLSSSFFLSYFLSFLLLCKMFPFLSFPFLLLKCFPFFCSFHSQIF